MASAEGPKAKPLPSRNVAASVLKMMAPRVVKAKPSTDTPEADEAGGKKRKRGWDSDPLAAVKEMAMARAASSQPAVVPEFMVNLDMSQKGILGIDVDWADGKTLKIKSVQAGAVEDWNLRNTVERAVRKGDRIIAVNGVSGNAKEMVKECKARKELELLVRSEHLDQTRTRPRPEGLAAAAGIITSAATVPKKQRPESDAARDSAQDSSQGSLYSFLPATDPENDRTAKSRAKVDVFAGPAAPKDTRIAIFLDVDGVLRRLEGRELISLDGEVVPMHLMSRTLLPEAMTALKLIVHQTGACVVLSSEWRRSPTLREELTAAFRAGGLPTLAGTTIVLEPREDIIVGIPSDPDKIATTRLRWAERRAREISSYLRERPEIERWVSLDDLDLSMADQQQIRLGDTLWMGPGLVLVDAEMGLTMSHARTAIEMLKKTS